MSHSIRLDVVFLARDLEPRHVAGRAVVVFDVLRATTSIAAALAAGVSEIRVFGDTASALAAGKAFPGKRLLCGEEKCLMPAGFDLGNSPVAFSRELHAGRTAFLSTTNGTRAVLAARGAAALFAGALVNASAVARAVAETGFDVTLLCAGTGGAIALEDLLGAGAVIETLERDSKIELESDAALIAIQLFEASKQDLRAALRQGRGGRNVIAAGLEGDIDYAAKLDSINLVGAISGDPSVIRAV